MQNINNKSHLLHYKYNYMNLHVIWLVCCSPQHIIKWWIFFHCMLYSCLLDTLLYDLWGQWTCRRSLRFWCVGGFISYCRMFYNSPQHLSIFFRVVSINHDCVIYFIWLFYLYFYNVHNNFLPTISCGVLTSKSNCRLSKTMILQLGGLTASVWAGVIY